jgi:hypothetical protein
MHAALHVYLHGCPAPSQSILSRVKEYGYDVTAFVEVKPDADLGFQFHAILCSAHKELCSNGNVMPSHFAWKTRGGVL